MAATDELFCKHGVYLGDANSNRPCPECLDEAARLLYAMEGWPKYWPYDSRPGWLKERYP